jgi:hypothetical protein
MAAHEHLSKGQFKRAGGRPKSHEHGADTDAVKEEAHLRKPRVRVHKAGKE